MVCTVEPTLDDGVKEHLLVAPEGEASAVALLLQHSGSMQLDGNTDDLGLENYGG